MAYIWKGKITYPVDGTGETVTEDVMLATETDEITETTRFYRCGENTERINIGFSPYFTINTGMTTGETLFGRVDYNKTKGNKIVIVYTGNASYAADVVSYTDDFVPGTGATYEFHFQDGSSATYLAGEVVPGADWTFRGSWWPDYENEQIVGIAPPEGGATYVTGNSRDGFTITSVA